MSIQKRILTSTVLASTLWMVPTISIADTGSIITNLTDAVVQTNDTKSALGGGGNTPGNLTLNAGFTISDSIVPAVQMNGPGNTFTIANNAAPLVNSVTGDNQIGIDISAVGGAGLLAIGTQSKVTSTTSTAIKFSANNKHAGLTNFGTIDAPAALQVAILLSSPGSMGTITNNAGAAIQANGAGSTSGISIGADVTLDIINSGAINSNVGIDVSNNMIGTITNKNNGTIGANGVGIFVAAGKTLSGGILNELGATIQGFTGGRGLVVSGTSNVTNAGLITGDTIAGMTYEEAGTIVNSGTISGTFNAIGLALSPAGGAKAISVTNTGTISAANNTAVDLSTNAVTSPFINETTGSITAVAGQIAINDQAGFTGGIVNKGTINATTGGTAINIANGKTTAITNTGKLIGAINLGDGSLTNNQNGSVRGNVLGNTTASISIDAGVGSFTSGGTIDSVQTVNLTGGTINLNHTIGATVPSANVVFNSGLLNLGADVKATNFNNNGSGTINLTKSIAVTGSYTQTTGNLSVTLVDKSNFGQLKVSGDFSMTKSGKLIIDVPSATSKNIKSGDTFDIITIGGAVASDAAVFVPFASPILTFAKGVGANGKDIRITANRSIPAGASVPGLSELNNTILNLMAQANIDSTLRSVLDQIEAMTNVADIQRVIKMLANDNSGGTQQTVVNVGTRINALLSNRLNVLRSAQAKTDIGQSGYAAGSSPLESGMWVHGFGVNAIQKLKEGITGFDADTYGATIGADSHFGKDLVLGIAGTYANSKILTKNGTDNNSRVRNYQGSLYGALDFGHSYIDMMFSYANVKYKTVRNVIAGSLIFRALGDFEGKQCGTRLAYNIPMSLGYLSFKPSVFAHHNRSKQDAYLESNAGSIGLRVDEQTNNTLDIGVGAILAYGTQTELGGIFPSFEINVRQDVLRDSPQSINSFIGGGDQFRLKSPRVAKMTVDTGLGLKVITSEHLQVVMNYNVAARQAYRANAGSLTFRFAF